MQPASDDRYGDLPVREFIRRLASGEPVPGGGSASALTASLSAALVAMVARLSQDRPRYAPHAALHAEVRERGDELAERLLELADADAAAYARLAGAMKLPRDDDAQRDGRAAAMREAGHEATLIPLMTVEACLDVVSAAEVLAGRSNRNAASDLNVAALLAEAAARGAAANVLVNLPALGDGDPFAGEATARVDGLIHDIARFASMTRSVVLSGEAREPVEPARASQPG